MIIFEKERKKEKKMKFFWGMNIPDSAIWILWFLNVKTSFTFCFYCSFVWWIKHAKFNRSNLSMWNMQVFFFSASVKIFFLFFVVYVLDVLWWLKHCSHYPFTPIIVSYFFFWVCFYEKKNIFNVKQCLGCSFFCLILWAQFVD